MTVKLPASQVLKSAHEFLGGTLQQVADLELHVKILEAKVDDLCKAGQVIILTQQTRDFLNGADPKALEQLQQAIAACGGIVPRGGKTEDDVDAIQSLNRTVVHCEHLERVLQS